VTGYLANLTAELSANIDCTLLTRTDLRDFALGASDIEAVCDVSRRGTTVLSLARLHAKAYVIDSSHALVTSANATHGGMRRNWEFGLAIEDRDDVDQIGDLLLSGFGASHQPQTWGIHDLEQLREPIRHFREQLPPVRVLPEFEASELPVLTINHAARESLMAGLPGWTQLVLQGILALSNGDFTIQDAYSFGLHAAAIRFPENKHPREKIRQQLQRLRDLGIIEFLGDGSYRRIVGSDDY